MKFSLFSKVLIILIISYSCNDKNSDSIDFEQSIEVIAKDHFIKGLELQDPIQILNIDSILVILENTSKNIIKLANLNTRCVISQFGKIGGSPTEFGAVGNVCYDDVSQTLEVLDVQKQIIFIYRIKDLINNSVAPINKIYLQKADNKRLMVLRFIKTSSHYLTSGVFTNGRFAIFDHGGNFDSIMLDYSELPNKNLNNYEYGMAFQGNFTFNRINKRLCFAISSFPSIYFYNFSETNPLLMKVHNYSVPLLKVLNNSVAFDSKNTFGFIDITSSISNVFVSYSGKTYSENKLKSEWCDDILTYDWEGKPIIRLELNRPVKNICYSNNEDVIFGVSYSPIPNLVSIQIPRTN